MKHRFRDMEKRLTFGRYPDVSPEYAREMRNAAQLLLRAGIDPAIGRVSAAACNSWIGGQTSDAA